MSLAQALTPARLADLAAWGYERGVRYFEQGRVASWQASANEVTGVVMGGDEYTARLYTNGKQLGYDCTCPAADRGAACKHVVALGLAFLSEQQPARGAGSTGPVFATREELEAFAAKHHVEHELQATGEVLAADFGQLGGDAGTRWVLGRLSLAAIGSLDGASRYLGARRLARAAAEAVYRRLHEAADDVRAGVEAELSRLPGTPLAKRLAPLRAKVREVAWPRATVRGTLDIDASTGTAVWAEDRKLASGPRVEATLQLVPEAKLACTCKLPACTHMLALLDRLLAHEEPAIAEELLRPPWQRALAELAATDRPKQKVEVWWQLEDETRMPTLVPILRKEKKRGGRQSMTSGARISPDRLLAEYAEELSEQDVRIAEHLAAFAYGRGSVPVRAFAALVGHPRVLLDDHPISVRRVPLGFTAHPAGDDLRLEPSVAGARFSPRLLGPLLGLFAPGEPLVFIEPEHARCLLIDVSAEARKLWDVLERHGDTFPPESHGPLLERIAALEGRVPVEIPEQVKGVQLHGELT
ncbi:MAG TPA: SWIM zinc finger family protein, partial [Kofleriaceae bacterium]|nr:SWIM zinc finger family protein [Kofleriaceae bacterium]